MKPAAEASDLRWPALALATAVAACYASSLPGALFWDSEVLILNNAFLRSFRHVWEILTSSVTAGGGEINNYYRPVSVLLLLCEYQLWGPSPLGYHAVNIALHLANACLLLALARRLGASTGVALATALLFAAHPIQNETVNYADHVESLLAFLFAMLAFRSHLDGRPALSAALWTLSLLSKEEGAVFLVILGLYERGGQRRWRSLRPHLGVFVVYALLRLTVLNFLGLSPWAFGAQRGAYAPLPLRVLTFGKALALYLRLLAWPSGLHFDRELAAAGSVADPAAWAAWAAAAAALGLLWRLARREPAGRLGFGWFLAGLLPFCGLVPFNNLVAEHFVYAATAGIFLALATAAARWAPAWPRWGWALLAAALAALYLPQHWRRNRDWQEPARLYLSTLAGNPRSYRAANNLGVELFRAGRVQDAGAAFARALNANPTYHPALNNLGAVAEAQGRLDDALGLYRKSAAIEPGYALARKNLAGVLLRFGRDREAEAEARAALAAYPQYAEAWGLLAFSLHRQGREPEAAQALARARSP